MSEQPYSEQVLEPGQFVGLRFFEGTVYMVMLAREQTNVVQTFNSAAKSSVATDGGFVTPQDSQNRNLLEPDFTDRIFQVFTGITPSTARLYTNFPSGRVTQALRGARSIGGDVGFVPGEASPFRDPSAITERWCTKDVYPDFDPFLPAWTRNAKFVRLNHVIFKYRYGVVTDPALIAAFTRRERKFKPVTMGSPEALANRPSFLDQYSDLMTATVQLEQQTWGQVPSRPA